MHEISIDPFGCLKQMRMQKIRLNPSLDAVQIPKSSKRLLRECGNDKPKGCDIRTVIIGVDGGGAKVQQGCALEASWGVTVFSVDGDGELFFEGFLCDVVASHGQHGYIGAGRGTVGTAEMSV